MLLVVKYNRNAVVPCLSLRGGRGGGQPLSGGITGCRQWLGVATTQGGFSGESACNARCLVVESGWNTQCC